MEISQLGNISLHKKDGLYLLGITGDCHSVVADIDEEGFNGIKAFVNGDLENFQAQFGDHLVAVSPIGCDEALVHIEVSIDDCKTMHVYAMKKEDFAKLICEV